MTYKIKRKVVEDYIPLSNKIEKELDKKANMNIKENLEIELCDFLDNLFKKYGIELNEELGYDFSLENDFYNLLNWFENYIDSVIKTNEDLTKKGVINNL